MRFIQRTQRLMTWTNRRIHNPRVGSGVTSYKANSIVALGIHGC